MKDNERKYSAGKIGKKEIKAKIKTEKGEKKNSAMVGENVFSPVRYQKQCQSESVCLSFTV